MSFKNFNFERQINANIKACGYDVPTPIQMEAIPKVLKDHDIMGLAQTGTGKTAAFVLPMLQKLSKGPKRQVRAVIVAPTRELAEQIHENILQLSRQTGLRSVVVYGGVSKFGQLKMFRSGVEIIVACPGRLLDHLNSGDLKLSKIEMLVLDEADMMFDMGFLPDIKRLIKYMPKSRQNLLFSATMPAAIKKLANEILIEPVTIQINHSKPADTVSHVLYSVEKKGKTTLLKSLMKGTSMESTLVFTKTKYKAKNLAGTLQKAGYQAVALQGNMSQSQRRLAMDGFRQGKYKVLVATDIAARGIDVSGISHVINFDVPDTVEAYTHRIGRTGRAQCNGEAITFASREDNQFIKDVERRLDSNMARGKMPELIKDDATPGTQKASNNRPQRNQHNNQAARSRNLEKKSDGDQGFKKSVKTEKPKRAEHKAAGHKENAGEKTPNNKNGNSRRRRRHSPLGLDFLPKPRRQGQSKSARPSTEQ